MSLPISVVSAGITGAQVLYMMQVYVTVANCVLYTASFMLKTYNDGVEESIGADNLEPPPLDCIPAPIGTVRLEMLKDQAALRQTYR